MNTESTCPQCNIKVPINDELTKAIEICLSRIGEQDAELKTLANTYRNILKVLDLDDINGSNIFLKIPKLIAQIQRNPEQFNFIGPEVLQIIDKYSPET